MKADYLSYKKATSVALLGVALQGAMGLTLLVYALTSRPRDDAALTGALLVLSGVAVWLTLAVLFDLHRRERIEQMEAEALAASGAREASVFTEGTPDDLRVAAKRLAWAHRILVPGVSLLLAAALAGLGYWRYTAALPVLKEGVVVGRADAAGWPIALGLTLAFVGFVFARYVAGMAKQPVWSHLRAGSGAAVAAALVGILLAVAHFVRYVGTDRVLAYLHLVLPALMVVLAAEIALLFLMGIYSPRKPGEFPRPAMDSNVLSFFAAPDRVAASIGEALNYQFGFDVTGNWFYQLLSRSALALLLMGAGVVWLLTCVAIVQPNEQGLRVRLGQRIGDRPLSPGAYFKLPWPLERVETYAATAARRINLGGEPPRLPAGKTAILWGGDHGVDEVYFVVRPVADERAEGSARLDYALVALEVPLYYTVEDLARFDAMAAPDQRENVLRSIGRREAMTVIANETLDRVVGGAREEISAEIRRRIDAALAAFDGGRGTGVRVLYVGIEGVHPPKDTAVAFEEIVKKGQQRETQLLDARTDADRSLIEVAGSVARAREIVRAIDELESAQREGAGGGAGRERRVAELRERVKGLLASAGGSASVVIQKARAERWSKHLTAKTAAARYVGQIAGFKASPQVYVARAYFDSLADMLGRARLFIVGDGQPLVIDGNLVDPADSGNVFLKKKEE